MSHRWIIKQVKDGNIVELGGVTALTRKGACYEAFQVFRISHRERDSIIADRLDMVPADDTEQTFELISEMPGRNPHRGSTIDEFMKEQA